MPNILPTSAALTNGATLTAAARKTLETALREFIADHLGADSSVMTNAMRVTGYRRAPNTASPAHSMDMSAVSVTMRNALGATVTRHNVGPLTNNKQSSGANGRDIATPFSANSVVNLFLIWNGSTVATIASTAAPNTGPALPAGYTHWAFADSLIINSASTPEYLPSYTAGNTVFYDTAMRLVNGGGSTTYADFSVFGAVPSAALKVNFQVTISGATTGPGAVTALVRPKGFASNLTSVSTFATIAQDLAIASPMQLINTNSTLFQYRLASPAFSSGGTYVDVLGYTLPNGDC